MEDLIIKSFSHYYGLDWLALFFGVIGTYFVTQKKRIGFAFSIMSCLCGFAVASISMQFGFVFYNLLLVTIMAKGWMEWGQKPQMKKVSV